MTFMIEGAPRTKKNSQQMAVNRKTGAVFPVQSAALKSWNKSAVLQLRAQFSATGAPCAISYPVRMTAVVYRERATGDLLNFLAAISDALEQAGVIMNDRQVVSLDGSRMDKDANRPRVELEVEPMEAL